MTITRQVSFADTENLDSFGRLRISQPEGVFNSQFTNDLSPLLFEQITNGSGATITHDSTNRSALMTFSSTPTGGKSYMQSYSYHRYQPGKSQLIRTTFNFIESIANCLKFTGYSDGVNGIEFQLSGTTKQFVLYSGTGLGNQTITQSNWNIDKLDGTGTSGKTLDITLQNHFVIDLQALYTGRIRVGFDIDGKIVYAHQFLYANTIATPYIQTANLPIRVGMTCTGTVSTTMRFTCSSVISEGGQEILNGYEFAQEGTVTAGSGTRTHLLSIRPKTTFNGIVNRGRIDFLEIDLLVTGTNNLKWELVLGQALTTPTYTDVNTTYSAVEYIQAGTLSGNPAIVIDNGYVAASNQTKGTDTMRLTSQYAITLDASGAVRALGTISLLVTGIGGTTAVNGSLKWSEIR